MGGKKDISFVKKTEISALLNTNLYSYREIGRISGVSHQVVSRLAKQLEQYGEIRDTNRGKNRNYRITTQRTDRKILSIAKENRRESTRELKKILSSEGIDISTRTLERRLAEFGMKCCKPTKKPLLTKKHIQTRLNFAKTYKTYTVADWQKVKK
jgi:transposase